MPPEKLTELLDRYGPALVLFARQWSRFPEDAVQEAFLRFVRSGTVPDDPAAFLFRVVRNAAIDLERSSQRRANRERAVAENAWFVEDTAEGLAAQEVIAALASLSESERAVVVARFWGGLTFEQVAAVVGGSASSAQRHFEKALSKLRKALDTPCPKTLTH